MEKSTACPVIGCCDFFSNGLAVVDQNPIQLDIVDVIHRHRVEGIGNSLGRVGVKSRVNMTETLQEKGGVYQIKMAVAMVYTPESQEKPLGSASPPQQSGEAYCQRPRSPSIIALTTGRCQQPSMSPNYEPDEPAMCPQGHPKQRVRRRQPAVRQLPRRQPPIFADQRQTLQRRLQIVALRVVLPVLLYAQRAIQPCIRQQPPR